MKSENKVAVLNIASTVILQGIAFFTTPIFTRMLGTEQYGLYSVFFFRLDILISFFGLGLVSSLGTSLHKYKDEYYQYRSSTLLLTTIIAFGFILIANIAIYPIKTLLGYDLLLTECLLFLALFYTVINFAQTAFIFEKKAATNFIMSLFLAVVSVGLSMLLISSIGGERRYVGRVLGQFITYFATALFIWFFLFLKKPSCIKKEYAKYGLVYGIPVIFHLLAHSLLSQSDREMMIRLNISNDEIGVYSFFCVLTSVLTVLLNALSNSWSPFYYDAIEENKIDKLNVMCKNVIELFTVLSIGFLLLSKEVGIWISTKDFWRGTKVIPILIISSYFIFLYQFPVCFEFYNKKTKIIAIGTIISALSNILLNIFMIPLWGMYGAAITTAISYFILFLIHYIFVNIYTKGEYHLKIHYFVPGFVVLLLFVLVFYILLDYALIRWGLGAIIGIIELYRIYKRKTIF